MLVSSVFPSSYRNTIFNQSARVFSWGVFNFVGVFKSLNLKKSDFKSSKSSTWLTPARDQSGQKIRRFAIPIWELYQIGALPKCVGFSSWIKFHQISITYLVKESWIFKQSTSASFKLLVRGNLPSWSPVKKSKKSFHFAWLLSSRYLPTRMHTNILSSPG